MSSKNTRLTISLPVLADHSSDIGKAFKLDASSNAILATAQGELAPFILEDDPSASGEHGTFAYMGITKGQLGATVAAFAQVTTQADGELETAAAADVVLGVAIDGGDAEDYVRIALGLSSQIAP